MPNSTQTSEIILLTEKLQQLEKRVAALESYIATLESEDGVIDLSAEEYGYSEDIRIPAPRKAVRAKRGRRPSISTNDFARRRDDLVRFLEVRWPDLIEVTKKPKSLELLLQTIKAASPGAEAMWAYKHLTEHIGTL